MPAELIFILIIIALSLLGSVAKQPPRPPQQRPQLPDGAAPGEWREPGARGLDAGEAAPPATWLPSPAGPRESFPVFWDDEETEEEQRPLELAPAFETVSLEPADRADQVAPRPEPVRPVLEKPEVDRQAEHARLHRTIEAEPARPRRERGTLAGFRGPGVLRRAVVAAEVLGPPLALRPPDER